MIRVLVVEDSLTVRKQIVEILQADAAFEVVGEAADGRRAIELCEALRPDVVTMDMMLPIMSGLAATEWIMAYRPTPIVVVSSSFQRGEMFRTYDAIAAGAVDAFPKPRDGVCGPEWAAKLKSTLRIAARIRVVTHPRARLAQLPAEATKAHVKLVAIGASTGGPAAVRRVLLDLPASFGLPVLLVVHVAAPFDQSLADWLDAQSPHHVRFAEAGESLLGGPPAVLLAPAGRHLEIEAGRVRLGTGPERHSCRPSVDVLFNSLASEGGSVAGVLLTGMGRDGADGLLAMRRAGARTIAQDEETSVIYGMPRAAIEIGAAERVLPIGDIGAQLGRWGGVAG